MNKTLLVALSGACLVLTGCSSTRDLDHIPMCQALVQDLLGNPQGIAWTDTEERIQGYQDLEARISFTVPKAGGAAQMQAVCYYEYVEKDAGAQSLADPSSAFSKAPHRMSLNGAQVSDKDLVAATNNVALKAGKELVDGAAKAVKDAPRALQKSTE